MAERGVVKRIAKYEYFTISDVYLREIKEWVENLIEKYGETAFLEPRRDSMSGDVYYNVHKIRKESEEERKEGITLKLKQNTEKVIKLQEEAQKMLKELEDK